MLFNVKCKYMFEKDKFRIAVPLGRGRGICFGSGTVGASTIYIYNLFLEVHCECMAVNYITLYFCASKILHDKNGDNRNLIFKMRLASGNVLRLGRG